MKKRILILVICVIALAGIGFGAYELFFKEKTEVVELPEDYKKFKEEYESLNGKINELNNKEYPQVSIKDDNRIEYKTDADIVKIMKEENALIYFGWNDCPWCRNLISTLIDTVVEENVEKIYYVDIKNIRDSYVYENKKVKQTQKGTDGYYEILNILGDNLSKFYVTDSKGKKHDTKVTRLYAPTVVAIHKGEVVGVHIGTIPSQKDPYDVLNEEGKKELKESLTKLIKDLKTKKEVCSKEDAC